MNLKEKHEQMSLFRHLCSGIYGKTIYMRMQPFITQGVKNLILGVLIMVLSASSVRAQEANHTVRFIEVTGSAEMNIDPDQIRFQIGIEEYWKEEFEKRKEYKDYITKIPLEEIDKNLMSSLSKIGISEDQITIKGIGQSWNRSGKDFKKSKTLELLLTDFVKVNEILTKVRVKGVNSMRITELMNKDITKFREQVKIEAMKAAKKKAAYLLKSVDEELGRVISVIELDKNSGHFWAPQNSLSNTIMPSNGGGDEQSDHMRKIKLKYEIKIRFEIK